MNEPLQFGAFLNLAQHHGFPTPLLDWSLSPFVAAWFAFDGYLSAKRGDRAETVRVFEINRKKLQQLPSYLTLTLAPPHVSVLEAFPIENNRAGPQQAVLTLTNMHDVEAHIMELEETLGESILTAYDLSADDAEVAMNELALMGITRSTLFPGVDGTCRDMKESLFGRN